MPRSRHRTTDPDSLRGGFSLTELLIVIAVIAVLTSMLLPAVALVRSQARGAHCKSNLRELSQAIYGYMNDNDHGLPTGWKTANGYIGWDDLLSDYDGRDLPMGTYSSGNTKAASYLTVAGADPAKLKSYRIYTCPAETAQYPGDPNNTPAGELGRFLRTYAMNRGWDGASGTGFDSRIKGIYGFNGDDTVNGGNDWTAPFATIRRPSQTILAAETRYIWNRLGGYWEPCVDNPNDSGVGNTNGNMYGQVQLSNGVGNTKPLHNGKWNYLFCDGHVDTLRSSDTVSSGTALNGPVDTNSMWAR